MTDAATYPQPRWRVQLDGRDISGTIAPRLMSLGLTSERGQDADQLDLEVSDHDGRLALPRRGVTIEVALGWNTTGLTDMGTFHVDEIEHAGAPDKVTIRARSAPVSQPMRQKRDQSWADTTVGDLVRVLAGRNNLTPRCADSLAGIHITHIDQTNESDLNILTRIAQLFDAVATVKAGYLVFAPVGAATTATGALLPRVRLTRLDGDQHRYHVASRDSYTGVRAYWQDAKAAKKQAVVVGTDKSLKTLRTQYATQADATHAATAEWNRVQRGTATFSLQLARGRADIYPEMPLTVSGWHPEIDAVAWLVKRVEHRLGDGGYTTTVEAETANAPPPKTVGGAT